MVFHIAAVSFLNTIPLIDWFEQTGDDRVALSRALPSRLGELLVYGETDAPCWRSSGITCSATDLRRLHTTDLMEKK